MDKTLSKKLIDKFGFQIQMIVCIEELSELQKELCKYIREAQGETNKIKIKDRLELIAGEIADVEIMLAQIKHYYGAEFQQMVLDKHIEKVSRLEKRVD